MASLLKETKTGDVLQLEKDIEEEAARLVSLNEEDKAATQMASQSNGEEEDAEKK